MLMSNEDRILAVIDKMDDRFDRIDQRLEKLISRLDNLEARTAKIDAQLDSLLSVTDQTKTRTDKTSSGVDRLEIQFLRLVQDCKALQNTVFEMENKHGRLLGALYDDFIGSGHIMLLLDRLANAFDTQSGQISNIEQRLK